MNRKDYQKIAKVIADHYDAGATSRGAMALSMGAMLAGDNPRFDMGKFLQVCGLE